MEVAAILVPDYSAYHSLPVFEELAAPAAFAAFFALARCSHVVCHLQERRLVRASLLSRPPFSPIRHAVSP
jgi:hypothetical protein